MKIDGRITFLVGRDKTRIELRDAEANVVFARLEISPEQLSAMLSRESYVHCQIEVANLDRVGKIHENKSFEFEIEDGRRLSEEELTRIAQSRLSDGWIADSYFGSQNSFFVRDGKQYARCTIRRWVKKPQS